MRITEAEIRDATLQELLQALGQTLTTSQLIKRLTKRLGPSNQDAAILEGRSDTYFSQKVRNLVSHRNQSRVRTHNQNMTVAAMQMAERKSSPHLS